MVQKKKTQKEKISFENAIDRLEEITEKLSGGDLSLEESLEYYKEGTKLQKICSERLNNAKEQIKILVDKNSELHEEDFDL